MKPIYGLIGEKLGHSFSPQIHREILNFANLSGEYILIEVKKEDLKNLPQSIKTLGIKGLNITIPYKQNLMNSLDCIDDKALEIGAINTIINNNNILKGYNTDYYGILKTFSKMNFNIKNSQAIILGNGGSAKAVIAVLADYGAKNIHIVTRHNDDNMDYSDLNNIGNMDIIINTTPVGMHPNNGISVVSKEIIGKFNYAFDLVYNPQETEFLRFAKSQNLTYENGLFMLVSQAIKAQEIWNNIEFSNEEYIEIYTRVKKILKKEFF